VVQQPGDETLPRDDTLVDDLPVPFGDLERLGATAYIIELLDRFTMQEGGSRALYELLLGALDQLETGAELVFEVGDQRPASLDQPPAAWMTTTLRTVSPHPVAQQHPARLQRTALQKVEITARRAGL
jgi:hypothetical protein